MPYEKLALPNNTIFFPQDPSWLSSSGHNLSIQGKAEECKDDAKSGYS